MKLESIYEWLAENKPKGKKKEGNIKKDEGSNRQITKEGEFNEMSEGLKQKEDEEEKSEGERSNADEKASERNRKDKEEEWDEKQMKRRRVEKNKLNKFIQKKKKKN